MPSPTAPLVRGGYLSETITAIRRYIDEPELQAKYDVSAIMDLLPMAWDEVLLEIYNQSSGPPVAEFQITIEAGKEFYLLPGNIREIHRIACLDTTTKSIKWEYRPRSRHDRFGPIIQLEGTHGFRLRPIPVSGGDVVTVEYTPGSAFFCQQRDVQVYESTTPATIYMASNYIQWPNTSTYVEPTPSTPVYDIGDQDDRPNGYLGAYLRIFGSTPAHAVTRTGYGFLPIQERQISEVVFGGTPTARKLIVPNAFDWLPADLTPAVGDLYVAAEIVPTLDFSVFRLTALKVVLHIAATERRRDLYAGIKELYNTAMDAVVLRWANYNIREGQAMDTESRDNPDYYD